MAVVHLALITNPVITKAGKNNGSVDQRYSKFTWKFSCATYCSESALAGGWNGCTPSYLRDSATANTDPASISLLPLSTSCRCCLITGQGRLLV